MEHDKELAERCRAEVRDLHAFFADWFNGAVEETDEVFARFADAMLPDFRMVVPSGATLDRATVLARVRAAHGSAPAAAPMDIEIRGHAERVLLPDAVLVTYEEWQASGNEPARGRASTAYLERNDHAPTGIGWRHVHETWMG